MWMWTLDDRLINMDLVESLELVDCYPDEAQLDDTDDATGRDSSPATTEPDFYELVARLSSGDETLLYESENAEEAFLALDVLASVLANPEVYSDEGVTEPLSVYHLLESAKLTSTE